MIWGCETQIDGFVYSIWKLGGDQVNTSANPLAKAFSPAELLSNQSKIAIEDPTIA